MLEIQGLTAGYPGRTVLRDVTFSVNTGSVTAIIGPNGSGKSTLLKTLCGILSPERGSIRLDGADLAALSAGERAKKVSYLAQGPRIPEMTVRQLVRHGRFPYLRYPRRYSREDLAIAEAAMSQMQLTELGDTPLAQLSGGQRQSAYIAMSLAQQTPVVLLDEPTAFQDVAHRIALMEQAAALAAAGKTVLLVLHDLSLALEYAHQVVVLSDGAVVTRGSPEAVFRSGWLDRVFSVKFARLPHGDRWHYYYTAENRDSL